MKKRVALISILCLILGAFVSAILYSDPDPPPVLPILTISEGPVVDSVEDAISVTKTYAVNIENNLGHDIFNLTAQIIGHDSPDAVINDGLVFVATVPNGSTVVTASDTFSITRFINTTMTPSITVTWQVSYSDINGSHEEEVLMVPVVE
jgi:hypothetical protein